MAPSKASRSDPWIIGAAATLFYLTIHSSYYNFDGVACAIAVQLGDWGHLVHGNHLAYGVVGFIFDRLWRLFGYRGQEILALQCLDSLLGGIGAGLFCAWLADLKFPRIVAVGSAAGLAVSQAYWFWSLEAQVYMLGVVFLLLAAREAFSDGPRPVRLGLFLSGAIIGHVGHVMFFPVADYRLWKSKAGRKAAARFLAALCLATAAAYAAAALFCVRASNLEDWKRWLLGSAALTRDRSFAWHGSYSLDALTSWSLTTARLMVDPLSAPRSSLAILLALTPLIAAACSAVFFRRGAHGARGGLIVGCVLWIASYAVLFITWEPWLDVYRISDLIPLWVLASLALERLPGRAAAALLALWVVSAGFVNEKRSIAPRTAAEYNAPYQEALWLDKAAPENAWVVVTAREQVYVPYFAHRKPINMRYFEPKPDEPVASSRLYAKLDAVNAAAEPVYITEQILAEGEPGWRAVFEKYGLALEREEDGMKLYRLRRKGSPAESRKRN